MKKINFKNRLIQFTFLFGFLIFFASCRKSNDTTVHINKEEFTSEDQKKIGLYLKNVIRENPDQFKILDKGENIQFYNYITTLIETFINTPNVNYRDSFNWDVTIIEDDKTTSAFITPGGHLFIYTGLLKFLTAENQLSSIIAHEISYADNDYAIEKLKSDYSGEILGDILLGNDIPELLDMAFSLKDLEFTAEEVLSSDTYSIELMCPFQYDTHGIKSIIEKANESNTEVHWLTAKRCDPSVRIDNILENAASCGEEDPIFAERYEYYKAMLP